MNSLAGKLLLFAGSLALTLGVLELGFRILDIRGFHEERGLEWRRALKPASEVRPGLGLEFRPNTEFTHRYDGNPRGRFEADGSIRYRINRHGHRGPDWETKPRPDRARVALLGDSFTFGEGVGFDETLGEQMEGALSEAGVSTEVLNLGVSAWSTLNEVAYLEQGALDFEPDLVLIVYVLNDAGYEVGLDLWNQFRSAYEARGWIRRSNLLSFIATRIGREVYGRSYVDELVRSALTQPDRWQKSFDALTRSKQLVQARGARFGVVIFPFMFRLDDGYPFRPLHEMVAAHCRAQGIPVLDLLPAFLGRDYLDLWVHPADQHPNEIGHAIAGKAMARFVLEQGLLEGSDVER